VGTPLAVGESLLLIRLIYPSVKSPGPCGRGFLRVRSVELDPPVSSIPAEKCAIDRKPETIFVLVTWSDVNSLKRNAKRNRHEQPNHQRQRTNRSQDVSIDL
jgi:hypothetical protein